MKINRAATQGSSFLATLGWKTQSRWDCKSPDFSGVPLASCFSSDSKMTLSFTLLFLLLAAGLGHAQTADDAKPASSNVPGQQYPKIDSELRATFRVNAPNAQKVGVHGNRADYDMVKGEDGFWAVTSKPLDPGFHYYNLFIDGVNVADPASESFYGISKMSSGIEVPSKGEDFYHPKDVPHGEVRSKWFDSHD